MLIASEICNQYSDRDLVKKAMEDIDFFSCIYERYEKRLMIYIKRLSKATDEEARDILQESFIKIWKNLNAIDLDLKLSSWIYRIVHNEVISRWRKTSHVQPSIPLTDHLIEDLTHEVLHDEEYEKILQQVVKEIPEKYREVIILKYFENMSYEEISDILKIPEGTVSVRLNRAKKIIEKEFRQTQKNRN